MHPGNPRNPWLRCWLLQSARGLRHMQRCKYINARFLYCKNWRNVHCTDRCSGVAQVREIEEVHVSDLSVELFEERYAYTHRPLVVRNASIFWDALQVTIKGQYGRCPINLTTSPTYRWSTTTGWRASTWRSQRRWIRPGMNAGLTGFIDWNLPQLAGGDNWAEMHRKWCKSTLFVQMPAQTEKLNWSR